MIQFSYRLKGAGWAVATIGDGQTDESFPVSYICDALGDFVAAVQSLFTTDSAECVWELEPGQTKWRFKKRRNRLRIEVLRFNEVRVAPDSSETRMVLYRPVFSGECDILDFALQVDRELQAILDRWKLEGYEREWHQPFPDVTRRRLQEHIKVQRGLRRSAGHSTI
jgi:hypothetical protein